MSEDLVPVTDSATGLEDFTQEDQVMPRLSIVHEDAQFEDNLTGKRYDEIDTVALGLVKQRVLWPQELREGGAQPLCKSYEAKVGHPTEEFPWDASGFDKATAGDELPCANCALKEWDSHPTRNTPWCSEQYVIPVVMADGDKVVPALLTFQRSSIPDTKAYISGFATRSEPLFTAHTTITLTPQKRGQVKFAKPKFKRGDDVDEAQFADLAAAYRKARAFLTTPRTIQDEEAVAKVEATQDAEQATTPEPEASSDNDDELF